MLVRRSSEYLYLAINMLSNQHATNLLPTCYQLPSKLLINCYFLVVCLQENPQHTVMGSKCLFSFDDTKLLQLSADIYETLPITKNTQLTYILGTFPQQHSNSVNHYRLLTGFVFVQKDGSLLMLMSHRCSSGPRLVIRVFYFYQRLKVEQQFSAKWCTQIAE